MLDIMSDSMLVMDRRERIVDLNPAALSAIGISADEAIGRTAVQIFSRFPGVVEHLQDRMPAQTEFCITRGEKTIYYDVRISELFDEKGSSAGKLVLFRDISERKKAEEALLDERDKLKEAITRIKKLSGLLPICASCKKIRDDKGYWNRIETYIHTHSEAEFSHGLCPECMDKMYGQQAWYKKRDKK